MAGSAGSYGVRFTEEVSKAYKEFRPDYGSSEVVSTVMKYCSDHGIATDTVVDVGCGTGQSTFHWATHFTQCIGVDSSPSQIEYAKEVLASKDLSNVQFLVGSAELLPLPDNSVDLITFGTSWHWMKFDEANQEIRRVLKKPGCFAAYIYAPVNSLANAEGRELVKELAYTCIFSGYPPVQQQYILNSYEGIPTPYPLDVKHVFNFSQWFSRKDYRGFALSTTGYHQHLKENPDSKVLEELLDVLDGYAVKHEGERKVEFNFWTNLLLCVN